MSAAVIKNVKMTCVICGNDNTRPETASAFLACPECQLILIKIVNGIPVTLTPAIKNALASV